MFRDFFNPKGQKGHCYMWFSNSPLCFQSCFAFCRRVLTYWNSIEFRVLSADWFYPDFFQGNIAVTRLRCILSPENNPQSFLLITQNQLENKIGYFRRVRQRSICSMAFVAEKETTKRPDTRFVIRTSLKSLRHHHRHAVPNPERRKRQWRKFRPDLYRTYSKPDCFYD